MKVVGYICSSIGARVDKSLEIKIQREQIDKYASEHNFQIVKLYIETTDDHNTRPAMDSMLQDASMGIYQRVIVHSFDRLSINKDIRSKIYTGLAKHGVEIFSITDQCILRESSKDDVEYKVSLILKKVKDIPSLPEVVTKVMELVSNPSSSAAELSKVISHDPGLTTRVLRLVNSAYYGFPKQISSIQQAIMILGFTTMRGLVLSTSIFKIFTPKGSSTGKTIDYQLFWKHSISVALCSRIAASNTGLTELGDAFSCGILHDIGKVVFDQYAHTDYVEVFKSIPLKYSSKQLLDAEQKIIGVNHADIGYRVADKWNLPITLSESIRCHHSPLESVSNSKLVSCIYLGNIIANQITKNSGLLNYSVFNPDVLNFMGLNEDKLALIFNCCKDELDKGSNLESFFE